MIKAGRYNILLIDKKKKCSSLFKGLRKHKYSIFEAETIDEIILKESTNFNLIFVVLYDFRDVFDLLLLNSKNSSSSIVIASENSNILKKAKKTACYPIVDLSGKKNINNSFYDCIKQFLG